MNYYLHRISHQWEVAYPLFDLNYLSIGWHYCMAAGLPAPQESEGDFFARADVEGRNRWSLLRFLNFQKDDLVVVPLYDKEFAIVRILERPRPVGSSALCGASFRNRQGQSVRVTEQGISLPIENKIYDIGFVVKFELLRRLPRSYADSALTSRMKYRGTNCEISDLQNSIRQALAADGPVSIHDSICAKAAEDVLAAIQEKLNDQTLELTIKWYMQRMGADRVEIPAKNQPGKEDGADADIIAEFNDLGLVYYIQAKKHDQQTSAWAVEQIERYRQQMQPEGSNITYIAWVVSTGQFDENMSERAKEANVRLIGGLEFAQMLLHCGIQDIDAINR